MRNFLFIAAIAVLLFSCAGNDKTEIAPPSSEPDPMISADWSPEQVAAYEKCLEDSMAFAMGWEIIQQDCHNSVDNDADPLKVK